MAPQVGIAADRRGEVAVVLPVQREVPEAVAVVVRLLHAAQDAVHERLVVARALYQVLVQLEGDWVQVRVATARLAQIAQHHGGVLEQVRVHIVQFHDVLGIGRLVDTVNALQLALGKFLGAAVVRDEHAFFDPRITFICFARHNLHGFARLVELAPVFGALEFQQAFLGAVLLEHRGHFGERLDGIVARFHHLHGFLIGDALRNVHDAPVEIPAEHVRVLVEFHHAGECAAVYALVQTAHSARKLFGEHGHRGPRQVLRVAAFQRLFVEFAPFGYVVAHVGNVHAQLVAGRGAFHANGVVVVHGAFGVNAEHVELAVVHAPLEILGARLVNAFHELLDGGGEVLRKVALFHEFRLDLVPTHVQRFGAAVHLR